jgi:hypothetical protein
MEPRKTSTQRGFIQEAQIRTLPSLYLVEATQGILLVLLRQIQVAALVQTKVKGMPVGGKQLSRLTEERNSERRQLNIDRAAKLLPNRTGRK